MPEGALAAPGAAHALRPRGIGEILDFSFRVYRRRFRSNAVVGASLGLALAALGLLLQWSVFGSLMSPTRDTGLPGALVLIGFTLTLYVLMLAGYVFFFQYICLTVEDEMFGRATPVREMLGRSARRVLPGIWTSFLLALCIFGGLVLLVIPGVFAMIAFCLASAVVMLENRSGPDALSRSGELIFRRGPGGLDLTANWFRAFAIGLLMAILNYVFVIVVSLPTIIVMAVTVAQGREPGITAFGPQFLPSHVLVPLTLLQQTVYGVFLSIPMIPWTILYYDIRTRDEGLDLMLAAEDLSRAPAAP